VEPVPRKNALYETDGGLISSDDARNARVVIQLLDWIGTRPTGVVIVFFGENHLAPIKQEFVAKTHADTKIRWIESSSFTTVFDAVPFNEAARFDRSALKPAGYITEMPATLKYQYVRLLTKGYFGARFTLPLFSRQSAKLMSVGGRVHSVYFKNAKRHAEVQAVVESEGNIDMTFETFDGSNIVVAVEERL
jgi:hypothetical protein